VGDRTRARARVRGLVGILLELGDEALEIARGDDGFTSITFGVAARLMMGVKLVTGSYGTFFGSMAGAVAIVDTVATPST
jgi:hypothetical protein